MNKIYLTVILSTCLSLASFSGYAQKKYIHLNISQANLEECILDDGNTINRDDIKIFPNPSEGIFTIEINNLTNTNEDIITLRVSDVSGKIFVSQKFLARDRFQKTIDLSGCSKGIYILIINGYQNAVYTAKLVIQ